jgi:hypothetical protein
VFAGSGYFAYNGALLFNSSETILGYIASLIYLAFWLVFLVGVASYLMFFTRNTFRMYYEPVEVEDDEDKEELND